MVQPSGYSRRRLAVILLSLIAGICSPVHAGRYEDYLLKAQKNATWVTVAATCFGGSKEDAFVAAVQLSDGSIVALGDTTATDLPRDLKVQVLGNDTPLSDLPKLAAAAALPPSRDKSSKEPRHPRFELTQPLTTGLIVQYKSDLSAIHRIIRLPWAAGSLTAGRITADGSLIVAGGCGPAFDRLQTGSRTVRSSAPARDQPRSFVMALTPTLDRVQWVWQGAGSPPFGLWLDQKTNIYVGRSEGLLRLSPTGETVTELFTGALGDRVGLRAVDSRDGSFYIGGDRNTNTGKEPWRQPYLTRYDATGKSVWTIWNWPARGLRDGSLKGAAGLVSDTSIRAADVLSDGSLIVAAWSDGGNSVIDRQPTDDTQIVPTAPWNLPAWGMKGANSLAHILRLDPAARRTQWVSTWVGYIPANFTDPKYRGAPNGINVDRLRAAPDGTIAIVGTAATGLIETPSAVFRYPADGRKWGGAYVSIFLPDMQGLLYSSYLPGTSNLAVTALPDGAIIVGRATSMPDANVNVPIPPVKNALQPEVAGEHDGYILLLRKPKS